MKQILKKTMIPVTSAFVGVAIALAAVKFSPTLQAKISGPELRKQKQEFAYEDIFKKQEDIRNQFDSFFNDDFFGQSDPFEEMRRMRKQMEKHMHGFGGKDSGARNPFDSWFSDKFGGGTINDISKREDDDYVYYDIKVDDLNSTSINANIENGYVTITGTVEKKSESNEQDSAAQSILKSSFNRTFPLPENVDQNKMQMVPEKDKVILKFPKTKL
jgi:HSP20 family molecular chaperone IbpA